MKQVYQAALLISLIFLSSCANMTQEDVGTLAGGVAGGILGSQFGAGDGRLVAIAAGSIAGAFIGGAIGRNMDENDRARFAAALENNNLGEPAYWQNERNGVEYEVVPTRNVTISGNQYCREYRTMADIGGRKQQLYGTACRKPDGSWRAVS